MQKMLDDIYKSYDYANMRKCNSIKWNKLLKATLIIYKN